MQCRSLAFAHTYRPARGILDFFCMHEYAHVRTHVYAHACIHVSVHVHMCVFLCLCLCICHSGARPGQWPSHSLHLRITTNVGMHIYAHLYTNLHACMSMHTLENMTLQLRASTMTLPVHVYTQLAYLGHAFTHASTRMSVPGSGPRHRP